MSTPIAFCLTTSRFDLWPRDKFGLAAFYSCLQRTSAYTFAGSAITMFGRPPITTTTSKTAPRISLGQARESS